MLDACFQDLRFAFRGLRKNPGFTLAALVTLALGIGANTAIYSVIDGVLLHPVPFAESDRLVVLHQTGLHSDRNAVSYPNLLDWRRSAKEFETITGWRDQLFTLTHGDQPEQLIGMMVTADFFSVLRVQPVLGRIFTSSEDERSGPKVVLLGEDFWRRRFDADPELIGKPLTIDGRDHLVIGIAPSTIRFSRGQNTFLNDVFLPIGQFDDPFFHRRGAGLGLVGLARLRGGVSIAEAREEMDAIMGNLAKEYPDDNEGVGVNLVEFENYVAGDLQPTLMALAAAVGLVLLIACTNVANLVLARSTGRRQEFGVRLALGAQRSRLVQQLLTESILLSIGSGVAGVLIAAWGVDAALAVLPSALPAISSVEINIRVLLFSFAVSLIAGVLFGLAPAVKATGVGLYETLKQSGRGTVLTPYRAQNLLIAVEVALTFILLMGAGLMMRSLQELWNVNPGFDPRGVLTFYTGLSPERATTPERTRAAFLEVVDKLSAIPGADAASVQVGGLPFRGNSTTSFWIDSDPEKTSPGAMRTANFYAVAPDHFKAMGIPLLRGRPFTRQDSAENPLVIVIDEQIARSAFAGQDPIGQRILMDWFDRPAEIIGIAGRVKQSALDKEENAVGQLYLSVTQLPDDILPLAVNALAGIVRTAAPLEVVLPAIKRELAAFDPGRAVHSEQWMTDAVVASLADRRFLLVVLASFAVVALLLSIVGVYGVASYVVGQRRTEIGLRIALGARPREVLWGVMGETGKPAVLGLLVGGVGAALLTQSITTLLFGVSPTDLPTFTASAATLLLFALAAAYIPARRAVRVDPMAALRCE